MPKPSKQEFSVENKREIRVAQLHQGVSIGGVISSGKTLETTAKVKYYWNGEHVEWVSGERNGMIPVVNFVFMEFKD